MVDHHLRAVRLVVLREVEAHVLRVGRGEGDHLAAEVRLIHCRGQHPLLVVSTVVVIELDGGARRPRAALHVEADCRILPRDEGKCPVVSRHEEPVLVDVVRVCVPDARLRARRAAVAVQRLAAVHVFDRIVRPHRAVQIGGAEALERPLLGERACDCRLQLHRRAVVLTVVLHADVHGRRVLGREGEGRVVVRVADIRGLLRRAAHALDLPVLGGGVGVRAERHAAAGRSGVAGEDVFRVAAGDDLGILPARQILDVPVLHLAAAGRHGGELRDLLEGVAAHGERLAGVLLHDGVEGPDLAVEIVRARGLEPPARRAVAGGGGNAVPIDGQAQIEPILRHELHGGADVDRVGEDRLIERVGDDRPDLIVGLAAVGDLIVEDHGGVVGGPAARAAEVAVRVGLRDDAVETALRHEEPELVLVVRVRVPEVRHRAVDGGTGGIERLARRVPGFDGVVGQGLALVGTRAALDEPPEVGVGVQRGVDLYVRPAALAVAHEVKAHVRGVGGREDHILVAVRARPFILEDRLALARASADVRRDELVLDLVLRVADAVGHAVGGRGHADVVHGLVHEQRGVLLREILASIDREQRVGGGADRGLDVLEHVRRVAVDAVGGHGVIAVEVADLAEVALRIGEIKLPVGDRRLDELVARRGGGRVARDDPAGVAVVDGKVAADGQALAGEHAEVDHHAAEELETVHAAAAQQRVVLHDDGAVARDRAAVAVELGKRQDARAVLDDEQSAVLDDDLAVVEQHAVDDQHAVARDGDGPALRNVVQGLAEGLVLIRLHGEVRAELADLILLAEEGVVLVGRGDECRYVGRIERSAAGAEGQRLVRCAGVVVPVPEADIRAEGICKLPAVVGGIRVDKVVVDHPPVDALILFLLSVIGRHIGEAAVGVANVQILIIVRQADGKGRTAVVLLRRPEPPGVILGRAFIIFLGIRDVRGAQAAHGDEALRITLVRAHPLRIVVVG